MMDLEKLFEEILKTVKEENADIYRRYERIEGEYRITEIIAVEIQNKKITKIRKEIKIELENSK